MRKHTLGLYIILMMLVTVSAFCEDQYRKNLRRLNWYELGSLMTDASRDELDDLYVQIIESRKCDLPVCISQAKSKGIVKHGEDFYATNNYGYGANKDGVVLMYYADTKECAVIGFGAYKNTDFTETANSFRDRIGRNYGWYNALYIYLGDMVVRLKKLSNINASAQTLQNAETDQKTDTTAKPSWYPNDISSFKDFHNLNAPRVVDTADIFKPEEEALMLEGIRRIQNDYGIDLVIFTDTDSYGLSHAVYSADFHHFNGYGFGDDYTGSVLFICMNPGHRGWWTSATGGVEYIYKDMGIVNMLDDRLEPYMKAGRYGEGVINYINNVYALYWEPDWVPKDKTHFVRKSDPNAPRLIDELGLFSSEQAADIEERLCELRQTSNSDAVILTTRQQVRGKFSTYMDLLYTYRGYGMGEDLSGVILCIYECSESGHDCEVIGYGSCGEGWRIEKFLRKAINSGEYDKAVSKYLKLSKRLATKGTVPKDINWKSLLFWIAAVGSVIGFVRANGLKKRMNTIAKATDAEDYIVDDSFKLTSQKDKYVSTSVKRVYDPPSSNSSGSSGGSYHSSGGRSYSGGGRSF